jgi:hypothetical protein
MDLFRTNPSSENPTCHVSNGDILVLCIILFTCTSINSTFVKIACKAWEKNVLLFLQDQTSIVSFQILSRATPPSLMEPNPAHAAARTHLRMQIRLGLFFQHFSHTMDEIGQESMWLKG